MLDAIFGRILSVLTFNNGLLRHSATGVQVVHKKFSFGDGNHSNSESILCFTILVTHRIGGEFREKCIDVNTIGLCGRNSLCHSQSNQCVMVFIQHLSVEFLRQPEITDREEV